MFYDIIRIQVIVWSTILISAVFSLRINRESCEQCPFHCQCREAPPAWGWRGRAPARRKRNKFEATTWAKKSFWNPIFVSIKSENFVHQSCNVSNKFVFHLYLISSFADLLHCQRHHRIKCLIMKTIKRQPNDTSQRGQDSTFYYFLSRRLTNASDGHQIGLTKLEQDTN